MTTSDFRIREPADLEAVELSEEKIYDLGEDSTKHASTSG